MKKQVRKLQLKKKTLVYLAREEQHKMNGGASITCPPISMPVCSLPRNCMVTLMPDE